ncbi:MAG: hypothetical protein GKS06_14260 [Acidobacteria bacterium]|nr:hypothetical protein [Acidobacteriota bacterium]
MTGAAWGATLTPVGAAVVATLFKGAMVVATVLLFDLALRRQSAALRHRVWTMTFAALLALPLAATIVPSWHVPLLSTPTDTAPLSAPAQIEPAERVVAEPAASAALEATDEQSAPPDGAEVVSGSTEAAGGWALPGLGTMLVAIWAVGAFALVVRLIGATLAAMHVSRRATDVEDDAWQATLDRVRSALGLAQPVRLARSDAVDMPVAWGVRRHTVLLPAESAEWDEERREVVLTHELAHVKRGDCAAQLIGAAAAAVHWFNPLVWIARRRQAAEREFACDDAVLATGAVGADYAWHLLEIARASGRAQSLSPVGVMMARKSQLEGRLLAALDPQRDRRQVSRSGSAGVSVALLGLATLFAGFQPWAPPAAQATETTTVEAPAAEPEAQPEANPLAASPMASELPEATVPAEVSAAMSQDEATRERVVNTMIRLLQDPDVGMRKQAAHSLGMMENPAGVDALSAAVTNDESAPVRSQAAWALGMIESSEGVDALSAAVRNYASDSVRSQAAWALGMIEDPRGAPALGDLLASATSASARGQAVWALGMIEDPAAVPPLLTALQDDSAEVRGQAAWALGMIESSDAVAGLVAILGTDPAVEVRSQAAWALGMIEDEGAVEALIDAVEDDSERVRKQALWAISQIMH